MNELWLVRHGESEGNVAATRAQAEGLDTIPLDLRDADVPLSGAGERQARALGGWLSARRNEIDAFWSSPYRRARDTLTMALAESGDGSTLIGVDERLRDRELGILDLLTRSGVQRLHPEEFERRRHLGKFYHRPPGGESWADVALRLRSFVRDAIPPSDGRMLIVSHDAVVMLLLYVLLPLDERELLDFVATNTVMNCSVTHLKASKTGWELMEFSAVGHLERVGAPVTLHAGSPDVHPD